jgi:hypothetical protein
VTGLSVSLRELAYKSSMARPRRKLEDFLDFTSTPEWRFAILSAALSFAVFHLVAMVTPPASFESGATAVDLGAQLTHLGAVALRFLAPLSFLGTALLAYRRRLKVAIARG